MKSVLFLEPRGTVFEVIRAAKCRGYQVIAAASAPIVMESVPFTYQEGAREIDHFIPIDSWEGSDTVAHLLAECGKRGRLVGVYSGMDPCAVTLAKFREALHLPTATPSSVEAILDKHRLRKTLLGKGLSRLETVHSSEVDTWIDWRLDGPAYFKPIHGFFSAYVRRCGNLEELRTARSAWLDGNRDDARLVRDFLASRKEYHLEEAIDGELLSVEGVCWNGDFKAIGLLSRILLSSNPVVEMGSCFPYPHPLSAKIIEHVRKCHLAMGYTDGFSHVEVIVTPLGEVEIIDFNPRFVGADVLQSVNHAYGIRSEEALLDWAIGRKPEFTPRQSDFACLQYFLPPYRTVVNEITFPAAPDVAFSSSLVPPGTEARSTDRQLDYLGCYLTTGTSFQRAIDRSRQLRDSVRINGTLQGAY